MLSLIGIKILAMEKYPHIPLGNLSDRGHYSLPQRVA